MPEVHFVDEENTKLKQSESEEEDKAKPSGKCMVCGRKLQAPESLRRMIGPVCAQKILSAKYVGGRRGWTVPKVRDHPLLARGRRMRRKRQNPKSRKRNTLKGDGSDD